MKSSPLFSFNNMCSRNCLCIRWSLGFSCWTICNLYFKCTFSIRRTLECTCRDTAWRGAKHCTLLTSCIFGFDIVCSTSGSRSPCVFCFERTSVLKISVPCVTVQPWNDAEILYEWSLRCHSCNMLWPQRQATYYSTAPWLLNCKMLWGACCMPFTISNLSGLPKTWATWYSRYFESPDIISESTTYEQEISVKIVMSKETLTKKKNLFLRSIQKSWREYSPSVLYGV